MWKVLSLASSQSRLQKPTATCAFDLSAGQPDSTNMGFASSELPCKTENSTATNGIYLVATYSEELQPNWSKKRKKGEKKKGTHDKASSVKG